MNTSSLTSSKVAPRLNYALVAPDVLQAMLELYQPVLGSGLEPTLLNLVKLRASQINACAFCIDMHVREAKAEGETDERLYLLDAWEEVDVYSSRERAALQWTEALTSLSRHGVSDALFAAVSEHFTEVELANLSLAIVVINGWNRLNVGFRTPPRFGG